MTTEMKTDEKKGKDVKMVYRGGSGDSVYGLGVIGAWVYYIGRATTFEERVRGFFKGLFWPAFVVHDVLELLNKGEEV